jgi:peptidoglycan/LPS O-acetylase OafA/YrhL
LGRMFSNRIFDFLGTISYSLYLWHIPTETLLRRLLTAITHNPDVEETRWFGWLLALCVVLISAASYYLLENPLRRIIRNWFRPSKLNTPISEAVTTTAAEISNA